MNREMLELLPKPKKVTFNKGSFRLPRGKITCRVPAGSALDSFFMEGKDRFAPAKRAASAKVTARIDRNALKGKADDPDLLDEGYVLKISAEGMDLSARTDHGLFYGLQTVQQLVKTGSGIPCMKIEDWPDMRFRGVHLMLGCLMPTFERMKRIVETMAKHKFNSFVIEYDHCFKWKKYPFLSHPNAYTPEQTNELEEFAANRFIEIIPCLDSLGHLQPYLCHPQLAHLRENPDENDTLCPSNPDAVQFMKDLWTEVLDGHPRARQAHFTGDEALRGGIVCPKCKRRVAKDGIGELVVTHYTELNRWMNERGITSMMWDDMLVKFADKTESIPNNIVMCDWMYDNLDVDKWSCEDIYWNNMEGKTPGAWESVFKKSWKSDSKGGIEPFPYLHYFHEKGNPTIGCTAASGGSILPYAPMSLKHANIVRFADSIKKTGARGIMNTFWPMPTPLESAWNSVLMAAEYGWHSRIETAEVYSERFASAFLGIKDGHRKLFSRLDRALYGGASKDAVMFDKVWSEESMKPALNTCEAISVKNNDADRAPFITITDWCARFADVQAELGKVFNRIDAVRLGRGRDTTVDIGSSATHGFDDATIPGVYAVPFRQGKHDMNGIRFQVADPARNNGKSVITLKSRRMRKAPLKVTGIKVDAVADRVFILCSGFNAYQDVAIAEAVFHMEDGGKHVFPIVGGKNILDWSGGVRKAMPEGLFASQRRGRKGCICWWDNPEPGKRIAAMEFRSSGKDGSLTVAAVTARSFSGRQPSVDRQSALKAMDQGEKQIKQLMSELSGKIYPKIMPLRDTKSGPANMSASYISAWIDVYRGLAR